jgi:ABC-type uncharacterized transport system permease subunit
MIEALLISTLQFAPPVLLAAMGGVISEKAGVVNIALEGIMRFGAFFALYVGFTTGNPWLGILAGGAAGAAIGLLHAWLCVTWKSDQIVTGIAINIVALGLVTFLMETLFGTVGATASMPRPLPKFDWPWLAHIPVLGGLLAGQNIFVLFLALPVAMHFFIYRTAPGLRIRAVGENPHAARSLGVSVRNIRYSCVIAGGMLAGLGGAALSVGMMNLFDNHMPSGKGFIALAAVVFGKWSPLGAAAAAIFFTMADALQISLQSSCPVLGEVVPRGLFLALPYLLTLVALAGIVGKAKAPAADGVPF